MSGTHHGVSRTPDLRLVDSPKPTLDPFTMKKGKGYDPDEVYIRSTDGHGNSDNLQCRVPIEVSGEVAAIVATQLIPDYRTPADFVRDAIVHRLHYVAEKVNSPELRRFVTVEFMHSRVLAERAQIANLIRTVDEMSQLCKDARDAGDVEALGRAIEACENMAEAVRDPYAGQIREIRKEYVPILRRMSVK